MKLEAATAYTRLRDDGLQQRRVSKEIRVALDIARDIFAEAEERDQPFLYHTPESWAKKWLPSKRFRLVRMPLNAAAMSCEPKGENLVLKKIHAREEKPIIVDYNRNQIGKSLHGFVPQTIVIDGKHRFKAAALRGETHIMAWVGELVALGGGGPDPGSTTPASGAKLNAFGQVKLNPKIFNADRLKKQLAAKKRGEKIDEMDVSDVDASDASK